MFSAHNFSEKSKYKTMKKIVKVVMLPTNPIDQKAYLGIDPNSRKLEYYEKGIKASYAKHLYLVSDEEIKDKDWAINHSRAGNVPEGNLWRCDAKGELACFTDQNIEGYNISTDLSLFSKVVATTDESLKLEPVPQDLIKKYIRSNGEFDEYIIEGVKITPVISGVDPYTPNDSDAKKEADRRYKNAEGSPGSKGAATGGFIAGARWMREKMSNQK